MTRTEPRADSGHECHDCSGAPSDIHALFFSLLGQSANGLLDWPAVEMDGVVYLVSPERFQGMPDRIGEDWLLVDGWIAFGTGFLSETFPLTGDFFHDLAELFLAKQQAKVATIH